MYCSECGAKNEKDALFCEECGAKLEQPKEDKAPKKKTSKKKSTKKLNKKQWIIIGIMIAVVVILFIVFQVLKTQTSPSKIVENYIEAINNKDYEKLYDYANYTGDQTFISKKAYTEAVKEKLEGKSTINNFVVGTTTYENGGLTAVVTVNATMRLGTSTTTTTDSSFEIKLTKEKEKAFLFFPKWTMADDELLGMNTTENYNITVPKDTEITYAGVKVTDKYLDKEEKEDYTETYILPQVLTTSTNVEFELPGGLEIEKEITPSSYSKRYSLSITTSDLTDKTKEKLTKEATEAMEITMKGIMDNKSFDDIKSVLAEKPDSEYYKDFAEEYADYLKDVQEDSKKLTSFDVESMTVSSIGFTRDYELSLRVRMSYSWTETENGKEEDDDRYNYVTFYMIPEEDNYKVVGISSFPATVSYLW